MVLKPCSAGTARVGESKAEPMEVSPVVVMEVSLVVVNSCPTKRKAEFDPEDEEDEEEEEEESEGEIEERIRKAKEVREAGKGILEPPEWDVDSFDGVEYSSPEESALSSSEEPRPNMEEHQEHSRIVKRQLIESKGFYAELGLRPSHRYRGIFQENLERGRANGRTFRDTCEQVVSVCLEKHNQDKGSNVECVEVVRGNYRGGPRPKLYITFKAREKPDGPLVEYQAKAMRTLDMKMHPILCRPAPLPKLF